MNAAELFVRCLEAEGVECIFGVPGEENAHFMMALEGSSSIRFHLCRHEQAAAFMADVYGRLTGKPGVCLGTLGPGATNLVTGVADANMDRAPLICITGQAALQRQHKESHQAMDVIGMYRPLTKWATPILHPSVIPEVVAKAFKLAQTEKPGACHIELAEDVAALPVDGTEPLPSMRLRRPVPDDKILDRAADLIRNAKSPVILAGNGCVRKRAAKQLRALTESTGIGAICTFMGKGSVSRHSDQCMFTIGLQAKDLATCAIDAADLVITIGYDLVEYHPRLWNSGADKKILHLDFLPAEVDNHYSPEVEVVGDLAQSLEKLHERLQGVRCDCSQHATVRKDLLSDFAEHAEDSGDGPLRPQKVLWDLREAMGPEDILLSDVGAHKMWIARYYQCDEPNTCLISNGFCSMGFALPGAISAKMIYPDRRVVALCGDGGFLMNVQELETAKRLGVNPVFMIWEDGGYGLIEWKQQTEFGRHTELSFTNPDFTALAEAFGCKGIRVNRADDLAEGLQEAFASKVPVVLSLPIDYRENSLLTERLGAIACPI